MPMPNIQTVPIVGKKSVEICNDSLRQYLYGLLDQLKSEGYAEEPETNVLLLCCPFLNTRKIGIMTLQPYSETVLLGYH